MVVLTLQFGSVLAKLSPDYLLATYCFAILWISFSQEKLSCKLLSISIPLLFLYLLKEVGFFLSLSTLIISAPILFYSTDEKKHRFFLLLFFLAMGITAYSIRLAWISHCQDMGFFQLIGSLDLQNILNGFKIFSDKHIQQGFVIFMKAISIGPADRLKTPYLFWYGLIFLIWRFILAKSTPQQKKTYQRTLVCFSIFSLIYIFMLYIMQVVFFKVGESFNHDVGLNRYLNIFFAGFALFSVATFLLRKGLLGASVRLRWVLISIALTITLLVLSRNQRIEQDIPDIEAQHLGKKISSAINLFTDTSICVINNSGENLLGIRLLYHLQPAKVNYAPFPADNAGSFLGALKNCNYCLVTNASPDITSWLELTSSDSLSSEGFFKVRVDAAEQKNKFNAIVLEKIF